MTPPVTPLPPPPLEPEPISSHSEARKMASIIAKAVREGTPVSPNSVTPASETNPPVITPAVQQTPAATTTGTGTGTEPAATQDLVPADDVTAEPRNPQEVARILSEAGIDLGVDASALPAELQPAYERLIDASIDIAQASLAEHLQASEMRMQFDEFKTRLEQNPDKLLLALAISKPDVFTKVVEVFNQMQADPRVQETIQRELQSEARLQEVIRREKLLKEGEARSQARQVISATKRAARIHGVDYATAEKVVALAVQANQGALDVQDVDDIVKDLRGAKGPTRPATPRVASPAAVQAARAAPTGATTPTAPPSAATPAAPSPGLTKIAGSKIRQLIRDAGDRVRSATRGQ